MNEFYHLGILYFQSKQYDRAIDHFRKAIELNPHLVHAYNYIGNALQEMKDFDGALEYYQRAIQMNPADPTAYINMGISLQNKGDYDASIVFFRKVLHLSPLIETAYDYLGFALINRGKLEEALQVYGSLLEVNQHSVLACIKMGSVLKQMGRLTESEESLRAAIRLQPDNRVPWQSLLVGMLYNARYDAQTIFAEHLKFAKRFAEPLSDRIPVHTNQQTAKRCLNIGYVSPDFKKHSVSYFIEPVLRAHDKEKFQVFCYSDVQYPDDVTLRLEKYANHWRSIEGLPDEDVEKVIRSDSIDILVDLAGHTAGNRILVFARRPAPVQISWIGYPATTGLSAMDYKIVDCYTDPPGMTDGFYTERLMRLPDCHLCYLPDTESPAVNLPPSLSTGYITFGSFNHFAKVTPELMEVWASILAGVPDSRLLLKANSLADQATRRYVEDFFRLRGIPEGRIELLGWQDSARDHLATYNRVDIALDSFPYNGTTTTCEALYMGVPVVALAGAAYASRTGISLLSNIGLPELVGQSPEGYANIAITTARDLKRLQFLRTQLRDMMLRSPIMQAEHFVKHLEDCYQAVWTQWCTGGFSF